MNRISEEVLKRMHPSHDAPVHVIKLPVGVVCDSCLDAESKFMVHWKDDTTVFFVCEYCVKLATYKGHTYE